MLKTYSLAFVALTLWAQLAFASPTEPAPADRPGWMERHQEYTEQARTGNIPVLFLGDSITDFWRGDGYQVWNENLAPLQAANFGISADRIENVLWRIENGELDKITPKVVVILIGTNNLPDDTIEDVAAGHRVLVSEIRRRLPDAKLLLLAVFPRVDHWSDPFRDKIPAVNEQLSRLSDGKAVFFLDLGTSLHTAAGTMANDISLDGLHLNATGYQIWADAMMPTLSKLLKTP